VVRPCGGWLECRFRCRLRVGDLGRGGVGFRAGNGVPWLPSHRLLLLLAEPLRFVELCLDGRGRGLRSQPYRAGLTFGGRPSGP
jgi:hypothetical protein